MGEASRRSRGKKQVLAGEPRCIYCAEPNVPDASFSLEHMPPIGMFRDRSRASGMEFACCEPCNVGTKAADTVASFLSLIDRHEVAAAIDWKLPQLKRLIPAIDQLAPGLRDELFSGGRRSRRWLWTPTGLIADHVVIEASGPLLQAHLSVFSAKLAMALYREHVGSALPEHGAVYTMYFLNAGLAQAQAEAMLRIMPIFGRLEQGQKTSAGQFDYRFNCDNKSILAALVSMHGNLHILALAVADTETYGFVGSLPRMDTTRPGELVSRLSALNQG